MTTSLLLLMLAIQGPPIGTPDQAPKAQKPPVQEELPPEEDAAAKPKEYTFNPLQAENEMKAGEFYFKRGRYVAAANRFKEATLWNPTLAEAFLRLGEADEKRHDRDGAKQAYTRFLEVAPDSKHAPDVKKRLAKL
jgi:outer membrane protein assembly factor BamD (BamD/ComL family)